MSKELLNPFRIAQEQFDRTADLLELDSAARALLRCPMREHHFAIPVRMDDGRARIFRGFRVQHNDAAGPMQGGVRFHPEETIDTLRALSMWMTWQCAAIGLPVGGSMGGVLCDPRELSAREEEAVCRGYVRQLARDIGPQTDVPEPELLSTARHMLWMLDEYETIFHERRPAFSTGKPVHMGGSLGRVEATGYGLVFMLREALKELNLKPSETSASFQGFGKRAQHAIRLYQQIGGTVSCVSCWDHESRGARAFVRKGGIEVDELVAITDRYGGIEAASARDLGYTMHSGDRWLEQDVDILVPAAMENLIRQEHVSKMASRVKVLAEGAKGATTPGADRVLAERGVFIIPDLLANAGGVTASYFERVQSNMSYYWGKDEVLGNLDKKMTAAFVAVMQEARERTLVPRAAAYAIAVGRVVEACRSRGWV